jgi:uncharacterized protein YndB with AHSA1/START domain/catechol 2,3-dioxygenase-like lactoylglutathione lyase family enzyme
MTTTTTDGIIIREITIRASAKHIFEALTNPEQRKEWWGSEGRFQTTHVESDLRVGGKWRMTGAGVGRPFTVKGEYRTIEPPHVLAFTWLPDWQPNPVETLVRFDLIEKDGVTTVRLMHSGLTTEGLQAHRGWPQILEWLRAYAETGFKGLLPVTPSTTVNVRYMVDDVDAAVTWYTKQLGFTVRSNAAPAFADVTLGSLRLLLSGPTSSAGRSMSDGARPQAGGWNRVHLIVDDLSSEVARLRTAGVQFRNDIVTGPGGSQILLIDPSGNLVELFQPASR